MSADATRDKLIGYIQGMTQRRLFRRDDSTQDFWRIIGWWEVRRVPFNLIVGAVGCVSAGLGLVTAILTQRYIHESIGLPNPPVIAVFAVLVYGVFANICYTGGWIAELLVRKIWPAEARAFANISFFLGLMFSVVLTLLPGIFISGTGALRLLGHALGR